MKPLVDELIAMQAARMHRHNEGDPEYLAKILPVARPPASEAALAALERRLGIELPASYREFLAVCDGIENFGVHVLFGTVDHADPSFGKVLARMTEFWDDKDGAPVKIGVPLALPREGRHTRHLWAFEREIGGAERGVLDWDNGDGSRRFPSFRAFLETQLAVEKALA